MHATCDFCQLAGTAVYGDDPEVNERLQSIRVAGEQPIFVVRTEHVFYGMRLPLALCETCWLNRIYHVAEARDRVPDDPLVKAWKPT